MIFKTDDRIQFRKQFIKNPTTIRYFISHFVLHSNCCYVSASGLGLWRADLGFQPRDRGGQGPGRAHGPNLAQVSHYIDIDVYSKVLWLSVYFLDFVYSSKYFKCSPLSLYSVLFSHIFRCWTLKVSSIISIGSSEMFSTLTEEVLSGICEYHQ